MIKVLIVDDSKLAVKNISDILESDPDISIIGSASGGDKAISMIAEDLPDVITMDINMPGMDGFAATKRIMEISPIPIIIVSGAYNKENVSLSFRAVEAGALAIIEKPAAIESHDYLRERTDFINLVKLISKIKVKKPKGASLSLKEKSKTDVKITLKSVIEIIAVGASTGGPPALQKFLTELGSEFTLPILIVQHIAKGFSEGFAQWLSDTCGLKFKIPADGEKIAGGTVYIAPDNFHMGVDGKGCIVLDNGPQIKNLKPAVAYLFNSVAEAYGAKAIGVLLTGMGRDGAEELKIMKDRGAVTFAQDQESSIVYGMPGEAVKIGAAVFVLPPDEIADRIKDILNGK
jgi:two-component system chemotaxis response regulator CheB